MTVRYCGGLNLPGFCSAISMQSVDEGFSGFWQCDQYDSIIIIAVLISIFKMYCASQELFFHLFFVDHPV